MLILVFVCGKGVFASDGNNDIERDYAVMEKKRYSKFLENQRYIDTLKKQNPILVRMLEEDTMNYDEIDIKGPKRIMSGSGFVDGWCETPFEHTHRKKYIYVNDDGRIETEKYIPHHKGPHSLNYAEDYELIITIHDKKGSLLFSKHYTWVDNMLTQAVDGDTVRNIITGKTPCDFTIIEPSGDSISYHLDPDKEIVGSVKNLDAFSEFINGRDINNKKYNVHDAIIYQRHSYCKKYYGKKWE